MGWPKGKPRGRKGSNSAGKAAPVRGEESATIPNAIDDLKYELMILKAALKQLIRENREWRIRNEKVIDLLTDRIQRRTLEFQPGNGSSVHGLRPAGGGDELQADRPGVASVNRSGAA
jgi:hypothetical protein